LFKEAKNRITDLVTLKHELTQLENTIDSTLNQLNSSELSTGFAKKQLSAEFNRLKKKNILDTLTTEVEKCNQSLLSLIVSNDTSLDKRIENTTSHFPNEDIKTPFQEYKNILENFLTNISDKHSQYCSLYNTDLVSYEWKEPGSVLELDE